MSVIDNGVIAHSPISFRDTQNPKLLPFSIHSINRSLISSISLMMDYTGGSTDADHLCVLVHGVRFPQDNPL
jgi:hypothetical protein